MTQRPLDRNEDGLHDPATPKRGVSDPGGALMRIVASCKALVVGAASAAAVVVSAWPAGAAEVRERAQDDAACAQQVEHVGKGVSPSCVPVGERPGITANHNETMLRDE
jgi:hypothetical protein